MLLIKTQYSVTDSSKQQNNEQLDQFRLPWESLREAF